MPFEKFLDERLFQPLGMKDTTFWPSEEQAARIAKAYKPGPGNKGLEETTIGQLYYPLTDRAERFPMPAGGLFSTAHDLARFYQMLLNGGQLDGQAVPVRGGGEADDQPADAAGIEGQLRLRLRASATTSSATAAPTRRTRSPTRSAG